MELIYIIPVTDLGDMFTGTFCLTLKCGQAIQGRPVYTDKTLTLQRMRSKDFALIARLEMLLENS